MGNEITSIREVLGRYWTHGELAPWESFVQKGLKQLQAHETYHQRYTELQRAFDAGNDDGSLIRTLHQEALQRMMVSWTPRWIFRNAIYQGALRGIPSEGLVPDVSHYLGVREVLDWHS